MPSIYLTNLAQSAVVRRNEAFSYDILIENEVSIIHCLPPPPVFLMLTAKLKVMVLYFVLANHRKFQKKSALALGSAGQAS